MPWLPCRAVTRKKSNKSAKFVTNKAFLLSSYEQVTGFLSKCTVLNVDLLLGRQMYCLEECMWAFLSPEILSAEAVKGLNVRGGWVESIDHSHERKF